MKKNKLLLIGWDAADWQIIGPLLARGEMPSLKKIIDNGVYGNMSTMNPPFSPMLWSSVATGKTPDKHGVLGFIEVLPDQSGVRPVTTHSRKTRALWNIFHNQGMKSNLVGWWPSYPAERINGTVISDKFQRVDMDPSKGDEFKENSIHPKDAIPEFKDLRMFPWEITEEHIKPFIPKADLIDQEKDSGVKVFCRIMAENVSLHNAFTKLLRTSEWEFTAVYYDLIDHFCHAYMKYHPPKMHGVGDTIYDIYKDAVVGAYRFQDMLLGRALELIDEDTTVIVMSDHGYESGGKRIVEMPKVQAAPSLEHRQFGIFAAMGPNIKKNQKIFGLGLIDVAPTILHHFGLPVGDDMDGKVALDIFDKPGKVEHIESWDKVEGDFGELDDDDDDVMSDEETMEQLIELGYIDKPDENKQMAVRKTKCDLQHNLAQVYSGKGNYDKSKEILLELIKEKEPIDLAPYYVDLMHIEIFAKEFDKAKEYLGILKTIKTKIKYNLFLSEAEIIAGMGHTQEALDILEKIVKTKYNPEIWFKIGVLRYRLANYNEAIVAFDNAIKIEPDKAKYHRGLAESYLEIGEYEEAVESSFTSIELVKYFPGAHYVLGQALEKLGDLKNAALAFETSAKLQPKTYHKAEMAKENVEEKIAKLGVLTDKTIYKYRENQIVIVSGLPRSGTSLMMQMLAKGGIEPLLDRKREADVSNPKGYFEYEPVMSIHKDNSWLSKGQNKAVKIVGPLLSHLNPKFRYKIIFMKRDLNEIIKSQRIMAGKDPEVLPVSLYNAYVKLLKKIDNWKNKEPNVEVIYLDYKEVLNDTEKNIEKVQLFIGKDLNKYAMAKCIDKSLYRNKV